MQLFKVFSSILNPMCRTYPTNKMATFRLYVMEKKYLKDQIRLMTTKVQAMILYHFLMIFSFALMINIGELSQGI